MKAIAEQPEAGERPGAATLADVLTLEHVGPAAFRAPVRGRPGPPRVYGGQLAAQALVAAAATSPGLAIRSLHGHFLTAGNSSRPLDYVAEPRTTSGNACTVSAHQGTAEVFRLLVSFGPHDGDPCHTAPPPTPPQTPSPSSLGARQVSDPWIRALEATFPLYIRFVGLPPRAAVDRGERPDPYVATWLRPRDPLPDDPKVHAAALAYMSDLFLLSSALLPHGRWVGDPGLSVASLDHSMWFHRQPRADDWVFYERRALWAGGGRAVARGTITDTAGNPLVTVMQEGLIRQRPPASDVHA